MRPSLFDPNQIFVFLLNPDIIAIEWIPDQNGMPEPINVTSVIDMSLLESVWI